MGLINSILTWVMKKRIHQIELFMKYPHEVQDELFKKLIQTAKECGVKVGICGQGPSDHPDFAQFLVEQGIDSISVTPDSVIKTIKAIYAIEQETRKKVKQLQTQ